MGKLLLLFGACAIINLGCGDKNNTPGGGGSVTPVVTAPVWSQTPNATPNTVAYSTSTTISASSSNADSIKVTTPDGIVVARGTTSINYTPMMYVTTTYTVVATNTKGSISSDVPITVGAPSAEVQNLTSGPWKIVNLEEMAVGSTVWVGITGGIRPCILDDLNFFFIDKKTKTTFGPNLCNPDDHDLHGTWDIPSSGKLSWGVGHPLWNMHVNTDSLVVDYANLDGTRERSSFVH